MTTNNKHNLPKNQLGIVSIIVTMIMMVVITLIVLTYTQIIRREQRQTLDRQLSSQAFYTAESAINVINAAINNNVLSNISQIKTTNDACTGPSSSISKLAAIAGGAAYASAIPTGAGAGVSVTCLQVNTDSNTLAFSSIGVDTSQIAQMQSSSGNISDVEIAWQDTADAMVAAPTFPLASTGFTSLAGWNPNWPAVLRVDLVPIGGGMTQTNLYDSSRVFFLYPVNSAVVGSGSGSFADSGSIINAVCNATVPNSPKYCRATISGLGSSNYYLRIRPIYRSADVLITPTSGGSAVTLVNGQIVIDVTARSSDVLKRISIRRSVSPNYLSPGFAIDSATSVCKRLRSSPGNSSDTDCGGIN